MKPSEIKQTIKQLFKGARHRPVLIEGPPGVGKTDIVAQAAAEMDVQYQETNLTCHDAGDIKFPIVKDGNVTWRNSLFPEGDFNGICNIDEIGQADIPVMKATCQVVLSRRIGQSIIAPGAMFVGCTNRQKDRAGANRIITPLLSRFIRLPIDVSLSDWTEWANGNGIDHRIISFLQWKPSLLHQFDPDKTEEQFPCPRTWHIASDAMGAVAYELLLDNLEGCLGKSAAAEFYGYLDICEALEKKYPIKSILGDPTGVPVPKLGEGAIMYAMGGALAEKCREKKREITHACVRYAIRMPLEFATHSIRLLIQAGGSMDALSAPGASDFIDRNKGVILAA